MASSWKQVFEVEVDGRPVKGEVYIEGGYRIKTTQKSDYDGEGFGDESSKVFMPPSAAGTPIEIEAETPEELKNDLISDGEFSNDDAEAIVAKFSI